MGRVQVCDRLGAETCLAVGEVQTADEACRRAFAQIFSVFHAGDEALKSSIWHQTDGRRLTHRNTHINRAAMFQWNQQSKRGKKPQDAANSFWRSVAGMLLAKWLLPQCSLVRQCSAGNSACSKAARHCACWCGSARRACRNTAQTATTASRCWGSTCRHTRYDADNHVVSQPEPLKNAGERWVSLRTGRCFD